MPGFGFIDQEYYPHSNQDYERRDGEMSGCWFSFTVQASCFCYFFPIVKSKGKNRSKQLGDGFFTHASIGTAFIQLVEYILKERNNIVF